MDTYRFFVPDLLAQVSPDNPSGGPTAGGQWVRLPEDQERHARQGLRLEAGQPVEIFDGKGGWGRGGVAACRTFRRKRSMGTGDRCRWWGGGGQTTGIKRSGGGGATRRTAGGA